MEENKIYEFDYLINGRLPETEVVALEEKIKAAFTAVGGEIKESVPGTKRNLAYPIKKNSEAFFGWFQVSLNPAEVNKIKESFRYEADLIRHLMVTPPPTAKKQIINSDFDGEAEMSREANLYMDKSQDKESGESKQEASNSASDNDEEKPKEVDSEAFDKELEEIEKIS